jgi:hypothetical protein
MNAQTDFAPAMLDGAPVGGPGGEAACDTCNRRLTDGERKHDREETQPDRVYAYAAKSPETDTWALRWVSCESCGPPGMADTDYPGDRDPDEITAIATLTYAPRIDAFALADPVSPTDDAETAFEDGESA